VNYPTSYDLDSMIEKSTRLSGRYAHFFRAETFKTLNNVTFGGPTASFTSSTFGGEATLSQQNTPRNIQRSMRCRSKSRTSAPVAPGVLLSTEWRDS
jgi:hypothetical protein